LLLVIETRTIMAPMGRALHQTPTMMRILRLRLMIHPIQMTVPLQKMLKMLKQTTWNATVKSPAIARFLLGTDPTVPTSMAQSDMGLSTDRSLEEGTLARGTRCGIIIWISWPLRMAFTMPCPNDGPEVSVRLLRLQLRI
jgi:hypothetical protein